MNFNSTDIRYMQYALQVAKMGQGETWPNPAVGCVIVSKGIHKNRIIAAGYNGFLPGAPHISRIDNDHEQSTVHAEQNAISDAARRGVSLSGSTAYITHFPCIVCAKLLVAAGISEIKFHFDYNNNPMVDEIFKENGIECIQL